MTTERDHLDAETAAAWIDGGLDAASLAAAEAHASNCERCRALLATVVRTEPLALRREAPGTLPGTGQAPGTTRIWRWWLAPIAAAAAAVTLWMVVPQEQLRRIATAPPTPAADVPAVDARERQDTSKATETVQPPAAPPAEQRFEEPTRQARQQTVPGKLGAENKSVDSVGARDRANKLEEPIARLEAAPARAPAAVPAAPPAPAAARDAAAASREGFAQVAKQAAPGLEFVSPDSNYRWRATASGIERSEDGGRVWLPVRLAQGEIVTAGSSPSPLVCWLVGRQGLVLLATDGTNFTRLPFPEMVDLTGVTSPETRIAVITAADGRVFRTDDAGRSWRQQ